MTEIRTLIKVLQTWKGKLAEIEQSYFKRKCRDTHREERENIAVQALEVPGVCWKRDFHAIYWKNVVSQWVSQWVSEWVSERVNEWVSKWVSEWVSENCTNKMMCGRCHNYMNPCAPITHFYLKSTVLYSKREKLNRSVLLIAR